MKASKQNRRDAKTLFRNCLVKGVLDETRAARAAVLLAEKKPRGYRAILSYFHRLVKLEQDRRTASVQSAVPLIPDQQRFVRDGLNTRYGADLHISFTHDPSLLGGMRIKVGSDVYDGTVRARLNRLKRNFENHNGNGSPKPNS